MSGFQRIIKYVGIAFAVVLSVGIIGGICAAAFGISSVSFGKDKDDQKSVSNQYDLEKFTSMDISSGVADLTIKVGDGYHVETKDVPDTTTVKVNSNGELVIQAKHKDGVWNFFGIGDHNSWNKKSKIIVTVPQGYEADEIEVYIGTGKVNMSDIKADSLVIDGGVGNVEGTNITAEEVDIDAGVGDITLDNCNLNDCDFDSGVGNMTIDGKVTGSCEIDGGVGNLSLSIKAPKDQYKLDIDAGVGNVRVNGEKVKHYEQDGNGSDSIEVDGGVGNIDIDFE